MKIAILITSHNRKEKTLACLNSLYKAELPNNIELSVFLVDDGSADGTSEAVITNFSQVNIIEGTGSLYWAGGMNLAWQTAASTYNYDMYLLLNDDTVLYKNAIVDLLNAHSYSLKTHNKTGIYIGTTKDPSIGEFSYGGRVLNSKEDKVIPNNNYQKADLANANILMISKAVFVELGFLDSKYIHGIADYDYSLMAKKKGFPIIVCPNYQGACENDHGKNWKSHNHTVMQRIAYLYSPLGLAYKEYVYYISKHFGKKALCVSIVKLWFKTLLPILWDKFKK